MLNRRFTKLLLLVSISMTLVFLACEYSVFAEQYDKEQIEYNHRANQEPKGKLYRLAKQENKAHAILTFQSDRGMIAPNIRQLVRRSTDIIVGKVLINRAYLNDEGDEIYKFINVFVQVVYKGAIANRSRIEVKQLGGSWLYNDGTVLTWQPGDALLTTNGKSYVFFLVKDKENQYFVPSQGVQSVFELDFGTSSITPTDLNKRDPVVIKYKNAPIQDFLNEIRSTVSEEVTVGAN